MTKDLREEAMFQVQMLGEEIQPDWIGLTDEEWIKALELCDFDKVAAFEFFESKLKEKNS
jgi:hypothetical protein